MKVNEMPFQNKGDFYSAYMEKESVALDRFDYDPFEQESYRKRWKELQERSFQRDKLHGHLLRYNQKLSASVHTLNNIDKLKDPETTVVVTGQQAGLLTGPLYTIHKCISAIHLAKRQERELGTPVVPIFWIAGEDHDFDEINHIHLCVENKLVKKKFSLNEGHRSVSNIPTPKRQLFTWVDEIVRGLGETEHTQGLKTLLHEAIESTGTITDFFAYLMLVLFADDGIVVLDSNDPGLRMLESCYFSNMIQYNRELDGAFQDGLREVNELGFPIPVESEADNSHLFLEVDQNRVLLLRDGDRFRGKKNECLHTEAEMLQIAQTEPERFSNNVISRPLMQDLLLPTLAFVAGPGEIAYWGVLKSVFHRFGVLMPPVMPRLSLAIVERETAKILNDTGMTLSDVLENRVEENRRKWLENRTEKDIDAEFREAEDRIDAIHRSLRDMTAEIDKGLVQLADKNGKILHDQLEFLKNSLKGSIEAKYNLQLGKFDRVGLCLMPEGNPQERIFNVFHYMNRYGLDFVTTLSGLDFEFNGRMKTVHL